MTVGAEPARVTYREVLSVREFRAIFLSQGLSTVGDQISRIAVALLVFDRTGSAFAASATYACSFLTWLVGGPVLSALADRLPRVEVMVVSDLLRAALIASIAIEGIPLALVFLLLLLVGVLAPPFDASRSSLMPEVLEGERYIVGNALVNATYQAAQVLGFLLGGALVAALGYQSALLVDAASFLVSAGILLRGVRHRPAAQEKEGREGLLRSTWTGVVAVQRSPYLRWLLAFGLLATGVVIPPEGLAVAIAGDLGEGPTAVGLMTAAIPAGFVIGSAVVVRIPAARRLDLLPALVALCAVPLLAAPLVSNSVALAALFLVAGLGSAVQLIVNAEYVLRTPPELRGRAYGVAGTLLMAVQGVVLLAAGAAAEFTSPRVAIAVIGTLGLLVLPAINALRPEAPELSPQGIR